MVQSFLLNNDVNVRHFFSTKNDGFSFNPMEKVQFRFNANVTFSPLNISNIATAFGIDPVRVVYPVQSHEDKISIITQSDLENGTLTEKLINTDALITKEPNLLIAVKTADCVPILIHDIQENIIAAVHAGWRGTAKNIIGKTIRRLMKEFFCKAGDIKVAIGPSIGFDNYEVGFEVIEQIKMNLPSFTWIQKIDGKYYVDLKEANNLLLQQAGIASENIEVLQNCTYTDCQFFSARRDKENAGRMMNGIMINPG